MNFKFSLKQIWTVLILFAVLFPVAILMLWYGLNSYNSQLENAKKIELQVNELLKYNIESEFKRFKSLLISKSDSLSFLMQHNTNSILSKDIDSLLIHIIKQEKFVHAVMILSNQGDIVAAKESSVLMLNEDETTTESIKSIVADWNFDKKLQYPEVVIPSLGRIYIGAPKQHDNFFAFSLAIPIGKPTMAVLVAFLEVDKLWLKKDQKYPDFEQKKSLHYLIDPRGSLLTKVHGSGYKLGAIMTHMPIIRDALIKRQWSSEKAYIGIMNQPVFGKINYLPSLGWSLISEVNINRISQPIGLALLKIFILTLLGLIFFLWLVLLLVGKTLKPIKQLSRAIASVEQGDYQQILSGSAILELDILSLAFNRMTQSVAKGKRDLQAIMDNSPSVIFIKDLEGKYTFINHKFEQLFHIKCENMLGQTDQALFSKDVVNELRENDLKVVKINKAIETKEFVPQDDGLHTFISIKFPLTDSNNHVFSICGIATDITKQEQVEEALRHSQKMDAIGQLSGGIAHEFNNQLGVLIGYLDFLKSHTENDKKAQQWVDTAITASMRCADLTTQLLAFSRIKNVDKKPEDINTIVKKMNVLIERSVTPKVEVEYLLSDNLWLTEINSGEFQDNILKLVINAVDAMPNGGKLTIQSSNKRVTKNHTAFYKGLKTGDYVLLVLSDTGFGMDKATIEHIFEPFFTTKPIGKGTGLGMSIVYGFVKYYGGYISIDSELNHGTHISLYLPRLT